MLVPGLSRISRPARAANTFLGYRGHLTAERRAADVLAQDDGVEHGDRHDDGDLVRRRPQGAAEERPHRNDCHQRCAAHAMSKPSLGAHEACRPQARRDRHSDVRTDSIQHFVLLASWLGCPDDSSARGAPYGFVAIFEDMTPKPMLLPIHEPVMRRILLDTVVSTCTTQLAAGPCKQALLTIRQPSSPLRTKESC